MTLVNTNTYLMMYYIKGSGANADFIYKIYIKTYLLKKTITPYKMVRF